MMEKNIINFKNLIILLKCSDIRKYEDENLFKSFDLKYGKILWNDYDLVFSIYDLYKYVIKL